MKLEGPLFLTFLSPKRKPTQVLYVWRRYKTLKGFRIKSENPRDMTLFSKAG